ncbi:hypothetical protein [Ligilactobacillus apodemi]|uniref:hypothetical protein n=1 Tax=Ligilactobacillus apodemi TaxID=307126 RepID=UPI00214C80E3|nr:hypothetical protein [Ligilactobacillus apodemi]MCR1901586.1 hypothetical protein [Ligilactobacillus apodemi]
MSLREENEKIAKKVTTGYKKVEDGAVDSFKKVEQKAVETYDDISDKFIDKFFKHENETVEEAKERLKKSHD